jgi:two-component system chemotaxis response regulator CheY
MPIERIMIVDEVEANMLFFNVVLTALGYKNVVTAANGEIALREAKKQNIQLVISAWEMSIMPGTTMIQRMKSDRRKYVPYLLYSKRMTEQDIALTRDLGLGDILTMPLDRAKATTAIEALIERENTLPKEEVLLRKIEVYLAEGKPNDALQLVDAKLKLPPYSMRCNCLLGQIWTITGQLAKAEECLKAALAEDPNHFESASALANVYSRTGRHELAIGQLQSMSQKSPKNISVMVNLGSAYVEADRPEDAKKTFAAVGSIDPDFAPLKDEQGKLAFKEGDLSLAAQLLAETQNGDGLARHFNNMAIALTHRQSFEQAIATYENAIKLLNNKAKTHALRYNLGLALAKKGELLRAFTELVASYKGDPSFDKAYAALARVSKQMTEQGIAFDKNLVREVNQLRAQQKPPVPLAS